MKDNKKEDKVYQKMYDKVNDINKMSPFPLIDTEYVEVLKNKVDYDEDPVDCCGECKSLYVINEDSESHCFDCRTTNGPIETLDTIYVYLAEYGDIWNLKEDKDEQKTSSN